MIQTVVWTLRVKRSVRGALWCVHSFNGSAFSYQESSEEKNRQLKERLTRLFGVNERRVQRSVLYGADLIETCFVTRGRTPPPLSAPQHSRWTWVGRDACLKAQQNSVYTTDSLRSALQSHTDRLQEGDSLVKRCVTQHSITEHIIFVSFEIYLKSNLFSQAVVYPSYRCSSAPSALRSRPTAVVQSEAEGVRAAASGSLRPF